MEIEEIPLFEVLGCSVPLNIVAREYSVLDKRVVSKETQIDAFTHLIKVVL